MYIHTKCAFCGQNVIRQKQSVTANVQRHYCDMGCKANYQRLAKPVTKEWLEQKYLVEKLDCPMIGKIVNRAPKSVWNWLKDLGIPTRGRGTGYHRPIFGKDNPHYGKRHSQEAKDRIRAAAIADGRRPWGKNNPPYWKGKKGSQHPQWKGGFTPERQSFYSSLEWIKVVPHVWKRDNATCQRCGKRKNGDRNIPFDIHHIISFACRELRATLSNLVLLCEPCHYWVHGPNNTQQLFLKEYNVCPLPIRS